MNGFAAKLLFEMFRRGSSGSGEMLASMHVVCAPLQSRFADNHRPDEMDQVGFRTLNCAGHGGLPCRTCDFTNLRRCFSGSLAFASVCGKSSCGLKAGCICCRLLTHHFYKRRHDGVGPDFVPLFARVCGVGHHLFR